MAKNQKTPTERGSARADALAAAAPILAWKRRSCGDGVKGPRAYDWVVATLPDTGELEAVMSRLTELAERQDQGTEAPINLNQIFLELLVAT